MPLPKRSTAMALKVEVCLLKTNEKAPSRLPKQRTLTIICVIGIEDFFHRHPEAKTKLPSFRRFQQDIRQEEISQNVSGQQSK